MSAEGIFANLAFCIPFGLFMFLLFVYFRHALPIFYHRNILCNGKAVLGMPMDKKFSGWVQSILKMKDGELLKLGGLDTLVTINTFRLILIFAWIMLIPCLAILVPYYYLYSDTSGTAVDFDTFTIADLCTTSMLWPPLLILVLMTFLILYGVYSFYANFVGLRQAFLLRPSSLNSLKSFLSKVEAFGSIKAAHRREDLPAVTVLLHPIPADLADPEHLKESLENSGIHGIEAVQFIGNYGEIAGLMKKRNSTLTKLETALKTVSDELSHKQKKDSSAVATAENLTIKEKTELLNRLISDVNFCSSVRPRHKTSKPAINNPEPVDGNGTVDSLRHFYAKLREREEKLHEALKSFNNPIAITQAAQTKNDEAATLEEDFEKRYIEETTFISWSKVKNFSSNLTHVSNLESDRCALLHFSDYREAARAQQIMLSARPNAMESCAAPGPDELIWGALRWTHRQRWNGALKSNLWYWFFVLLFAPIIAAVVAFIDMSSLGKWIPAIETFRLQHPNVRAILEGVLAPFIATMLMKQAGKLISKLMLMRGCTSRSELVLKVQSAHLFFLFIQVIVIGAIFSNLYEFAATAIANNYKLGGFLTVLRENIPKKSHFFFNFMLQDVFSELMLELLNPKSLFLDRGFLNKTLRKGKTTRSLLIHDTTPPELELAIVWSRFIMFPFFIFTTYAIISPLIVIPTLAYFSYAYFVFRFRFAQFGKVSVETGGKYWTQCSRQVIYALLLGQLSVFLQYTQFRKGILPACLIVFLLGITLAFIPFLSQHFGRICNNLSVLEEEAQKSKNLAVSLLEDRNEAIVNGVECLGNSEIVKSKLENEISEHLNFIDIDPLATVQKGFNPPEIQPKSEEAALFDPYWSTIPLNLNSIESTAVDTFDPYQVDRLVDVQYINKQYSHPLIMKHSQVLFVSKSLPFLLLQEKKSTE